MNSCYLLGYPVRHSMSAMMHNAAFQSMGLDFEFKLVSIKPEELESFLDSEMRYPSVRGASVTLPHKVSIMRCLDELDEAARRCGSVNTIVNENGILKGYNTDGTGAIKSLKEELGDLTRIKVVMMGAGGAARSIGFQLSTIVSELVILNRTLSTAEELAKSISEVQGNRATVSAQPIDYLGEALEKADLLINTTSVGMSPKTGETIVSKELLNPSIFVFDIIYNPLKTRLLREAEEAGARTLNGVDMLVYQGAEAFKLWTGHEAPIGLMRRSVMSALEAVSP